ncbi:MAG: class I SAM-dependent methyltransferase [Thermodesulfobacteriota bacterium]|nr:class I SAM-dependent methyltransferase [Thermodesulfobacteriota bacterium]
MVENGPSFQWSYGLVPLSRHETHDKVIEMIGKEPRGKILDVPTGTGVLADRLRKMGFEVCCCDITSNYFSIPDLKVEIGDLNQRLPYENHSFNYLVCLDGIEHTENPSSAIREFSRILKKGGKIFLSLPNFLNIERRLRFLFMGTFSKIPTHETIRDIWKGDLSMAHLNPLGYPLLKFMMEHYGFRILQLEKDRKKPRMKWLLPLVWVIRLYGLFTPGKRKEIYRLDETMMDEIIMGGNTLIIVGEKIV